MGHREVYVMSARVHQGYWCGSLLIVWRHRYAGVCPSAFYFCGKERIGYSASEYSQHMYRYMAAASKYIARHRLRVTVGTTVPCTTIGKSENLFRIRMSQRRKKREYTVDGSDNQRTAVFTMASRTGTRRLVLAPGYDDDATPPPKFASMCSTVRFRGAPLLVRV